jgi:hypothetical protein
VAKKLRTRALARKERERLRKEEQESKGNNTEKGGGRIHRLQRGKKRRGITKRVRDEMQEDVEKGIKRGKEGSR